MATNPTLIASKPLRYNAREMKAGDEFRASPRDARLLVALSRASFKPPAVMSAVPAAVTPALPDGVAELRKRSYKRRDMTAEDGEARPLSLSLIDLTPQESGVSDVNPDADA